MPMEEPSGPTSRAATVVTWPQPLPAAARGAPVSRARRSAGGGEKRHRHKMLLVPRTDVQKVVAELEADVLEGHRLERRRGDVEVERVDAEGAVRERHLLLVRG